VFLEDHKKQLRKKTESEKQLKSELAEVSESKSKLE
jgi:hypothetical protein